MAALDGVPAAGGLGECAALVRSADALRFSAPELAVQLARRALVIGAESAAAGSGDQVDQARALSMRAHAVLAAGLVRTSHYVDAAEPALAALVLAESGGVTELATSVRLDLAACAREVGEPLLGCALLRPVLETAQHRPSVRAVALGRLVGCTAHIGRRDDVEDALAEADRLLGSDDGLSPDARRMERARLSVRAAAYHRWYGDTEDAIDAAREGIGQLNRLRGSRPETDRLRAQLVLELACALLDEGDLAEAESASTAVLAAPVRATAAAATGQLMLAVSTRIHLPSGRVERGRLLLDQAARIGDRHGLDDLLADALTTVSQLDEQAGHLDDALESLHGARSAEQRRLRTTAKAARQILIEVSGAGDWDAQAASALLRQAARLHAPAVAAVSPISTQPAPAETDEATGLLNREGLYRRLGAVRNGERPVALALVRLAEKGARSGVNLTELAAWVRDLAPENAELARSDGSELAVLLPRTTRDQAERFAQSIRDTAIRSDWLTQANAESISTGVGQSNPEATTVDARALLTAARDALTPAEPPRRPGERTQPVPATALTAKALAELEDVGDTLRIGRAIINSLSIPAGSGGKRRAETGTHPTVPDPTQGPDTSTSHHPAAPSTPTDASGYHAAAWSTQAGTSSGDHSANLSAGADTSSDYRFASPGTRSDTSSGDHSANPSAGADTSSDYHSANASTWADSSSDYRPETFSAQADLSPGHHSATPDPATHGSSSPHRTVSESTADHSSDPGPPAPRSSSGTIPPGSASSPSGSAPAEPGHGTTPSRSVGETGGYRPLISFQPTSEPEPTPPPSDRTERGYASSYEETRAELARLMSALESGTLPDPPSSDPPRDDAGSDPNTRSASADPTIGPRTDSGPAAGKHSGDPPGTADEPPGVSTGVGGRWSFAPLGESTSLPAPARPGDDHGRDLGGDHSGNASPSQSIPVPPEPDDVPEPPRRPETPEPDEPDPIPAPPPDPGPVQPDPGPVAPDLGSARGSVPSDLGQVTSEAGRASSELDLGSVLSGLGRASIPGPVPSEASGHVPSGSDPEPAPGESPPTPLTWRERRAERSGGSSTIAGLLADALVAYQETSRDNEEEPDRQQDHPPQVTRPGASPDEGFTSFDRLFDWRYQSPASGRHRSPE